MESYHHRDRGKWAMFHLLYLPSRQGRPEMATPPIALTELARKSD